jgi:hypothetical protein
MSVNTLMPIAMTPRTTYRPPAAARAAAPGAPPQPRFEPHPVLHQAITGARLNGHWPEILSDLGLLGSVRLELTTARVRFSDELSLAGLRFHGPMATLGGDTQSLRLLLERCHALAATPEGDALLLEDDLRRPLLRLTRAAGSAAWLWRLVRGGVLGGAERVVPLNQPAPLVTSLEDHPLGILQALCTDDAPDFVDTAELSGQLALAAGRLRRDAANGGGAAVAVDPALIPCVLRSLCEQALPIELSLGCDALVLRRRAAFDAYDYAQGRAQLAGDGAQMAIDVAAIDSAWVVGAAGRGRQLRLYDADGRALAVIAAVPCSGGCSGGASGACGGEPCLWRSLMNALES